MIIILPGTVQAQQSPVGQVVGLVFDSLSGTPVSDALVYFDQGRSEVSTDGAGRFTIAAAAGDTILFIRRVGYVPRRLSVPASATSARLDLGRVALRAVATRLDVLAVEAEAVRIQPHLSDFYRRKQQGLAGFFVTRDDIEQAGVHKTSDMLQRTPKVVVDCPAPTTWTKPGGEPSAASECTVRNRRASPVKPTKLDVERCEIPVYIDGQRTTRTLDDVPLADVAAIEVYSGPATTPAVFGSGHCGVAALWLIH